MNMLAYIVSGGGLGSLLLWFVGLVIVFAIVYWILKQLAAPAFAFTILYVLCALLLLVVVIDFFFSGGPVVVR